MMSDRGVSFKIVFITSLVMVTSGVDEPPSRYLRLPECISSVVILPHIKQVRLGLDPI